MEITLSKEAIAGFVYVAGVDGITTEARVSKFVEDKGLEYYQHMKKMEVANLLQKVEKNPLAYKASIEAIAVVEEQKEADLKAEELKGEEDVLITKS